MTVRLNAGSPFLFDADSGRVVGIKSPDGAENRFTFAGDLVQSVRNTDGVTGNAGQDQGAAINRAIVAAAARGYSDLYFPDGYYDTTVPIVQLPGVTLRFAKNATIRATQSMPALVQTPADQPLFYVGIYGGRLNCNGLADAGLDAQWFQGYKVRDVEIENTLSVGARFGLVGTPYSSYEPMVDNLRTFRGSGTVQAGSVALHVRAATDGQYSHCVLNGSETGVLTSANTGGRFHAIHPWVRESTGRLLYAFDDQSGTCRWEECIADTANIAGWRLSFGNSVVNGGLAFMNSLGGVDNTADAVLITSTTPNVAVMGLATVGVSSSYRWRTNVNYAAVTRPDRLQMLGNVCNNVVTEAPMLIGSGVPIEECFPSGVVTGRRYKMDNVRRWEDRFDASGNRARLRYDASGNLLGTTIAENLATGQVSMTDGGVTVAGTWDKPLTIGSANYWTNATSAKLYAKAVAAGAPTSDTDGAVVGTQT